MTEHTAGQHDLTGFAYFMLRVRREADRPGSVSGTIERLGTGEKSSFADSRQLLELLHSWPTDRPKMSAAPADGNLSNGSPS